MFPIKTFNKRTLNATLCLDLYGNLYFDLSKYKDDDYFSVQLTESLYQMGVDKNNLPIGESGIYKIIEHNDIIYDKNMIDTDVTEKYGESNIMFDMKTYTAPSIDINDREDGDICALYDTYIYKNKDLCTKSESANGESLYEFIVHLEGDFLFRPKVDKINKYEVRIKKNGELIFIRI